MKPLKIINVRGYEGLPNQFMVESEDGWLSKDSFTTDLGKATIFATKEKAIAEAKRLYPELSL